MRDVEILPNGRDIRPGSTIMAKNLALADRISPLLDAEPGPYYIPYEVVDADLARRKGVRPDNIYGGVVRSVEHADKAMLHVRADGSEAAPKWYESAMAESLDDAVLPGFTVFSAEEALVAYDKLSYAGLECRVKDPNERNSRGQWEIADRKSMEGIGYLIPGIDGFGAVIEANVPNSISCVVGFVALNSALYTWCGRSWEIDVEGESKFGGSELTLVRGGFHLLGQTLEDMEQQLAVRQAQTVVDAYSRCGAKISRAVFDVIQGKTENGDFVSGVTDPSIRPSASSPAEIFAIEKMVEKPDLVAVKSGVMYDYGHQLDADLAGELFAASRKASIYVSLLDARDNDRSENHV